MKKTKIKAEINVVPYIDVMLVLLIIFMITAPMLTQGIDVNLPKTKFSETVDPSKNTVFFIVSINKDGKIFLSNTEEKTQSTNPISLKELKIKLNAYQKAFPQKDTKTFIKADKDVNYGIVVNVLSSLKGNIKGKVGLMTENLD